MPTITFIGADGTKYAVEAEIGQSVRDAALQNDVPGIDGDCGGNCACGTCHVYVPPEWADRTGSVEAESMEESLLQFADDCRETSRLSCQIPVTDELDGLVVDVPLGQH